MPIFVMNAATLREKLLLELSKLSTDVVDLVKGIYDAHGVPADNLYVIWRFRSTVLPGAFMRVVITNDGLHDTIGMISGLLRYNTPNGQAFEAGLGQDRAYTRAPTATVEGLLDYVDLLTEIKTYYTTNTGLPTDATLIEKDPLPTPPDPGP